jgi:hypothetical protein
MRTLTLFVLCGVIATSTSGASAVRSLPYSLAQRGCTQEDAPALELFLLPVGLGSSASPIAPYLRIEIAWTDWTRLVEREITVQPLRREYSGSAAIVVRAAWHPPEGLPIWLQGSLRLGRVEVDRRVEGTYRFVAPTGQRWSGAFAASWRARSVTCG